VTEPVILIVEDDADIFRSLEVILTRLGYEVHGAADGAKSLEIVERVHPNLVILDIGLPGMDGWTVLERLRRRSHIPVLLLTARGLESDKVRGLLGGADDYMTKPFSNAELVARVRALLRRAVVEEDGPTDYVDDRLRIDFTSQTLDVDGNRVLLTPAEFRLLTVLVQNAGHVLSADELLEQAWHDPSGIGQGRIKFTVLTLRRKLGWTDLASCPIETVRGFGYRYRCVAPST
jgi:DNA-binding response OmpR family regulator